RERCHRLGKLRQHGKRQYIYQDLSQVDVDWLDLVKIPPQGKIFAKVTTFPLIIPLLRLFNTGS
ncbi:MAG: hypothetical protein K2L77_02875, partial [Muribaculaceae bacterium]|nr:hypothetical protein [Muribaculaceae bacterium]